MHDKNEIDALDFNEYESTREKFRIKKEKRTEKETEIEVTGEKIKVKYHNIFFSEVVRSGNSASVRAFKKYIGRKAIVIILDEEEN